VDRAVSSDPAVQAQLDRLAKLSPGRDILGLERIRALLDKLGNPERALPPVLHVAGTNGKGSTCAFLRAAIEAAGLKAHVYTSPHLVRFNERIRLAGRLIEDAALAAVLADTLDAAGIPFCKGGVMASNAQWRRSLAGWERALDDWAQRAEGENLLSVDIFYDFVGVQGEPALAETLRELATRAGRRPMLPRMLAQQLAGIGPPIGLFGGLKGGEGRLDLKLHGLVPIVAGARAMALKHGVAATATAERLRALAAAGL
jgi:hypothetical protein